MTRERVGRVVSGVASLGFLGTAALHGSGTSMVRAAEQCPEALRQVVPALWLAYSVDLTVIGLIVAVAAVRPHASSRWILALAAACPLAGAALQVHFFGFVPPTAILVTVGLLTLAGAAASSSA